MSRGKWAFAAGMTGALGLLQCYGERSFDDQNAGGAGGASGGASAAAGGNTSSAGQGGALTGGTTGAGGTLPTNWCGEQARPAGILDADYDCLDFDDGELQWSALGNTAIELSSLLAKSAPHSIYINARSGESGFLTWSTLGGSTVESVTLSAEINLRGWSAWPPPWDDGANLMCIKVGNASNCLKFEHGSTDRVYIETIPCTVQIPSECAVAVLPAAATWTQIKMVLTPQRQIQLSFNDVSVVTSCSAAYCTDTAAQVEVGLAGVGDSGYAVSYDNVTVAVGR